MDPFDGLIGPLLAVEGGYDQAVSALEDMIRAALRVESSRLPYTQPDQTNARSYGCGHEGCDRRAYAKGLCNTHYIRMRSGRSMDAPIAFRGRGTICNECDSPLNGKGGWGLCSRHFKRRRHFVVKRTLISALGGVCRDCGGTFHPAAFDFHHLGNKEASVSKLLQSHKISSLCAEIVKCTLLCANCHRVEHANDGSV